MRLFSIALKVPKPPDAACSDTFDKDGNFSMSSIFDAEFNKSEL